MLDVCFAGDAHIGDVSSSVGAQGWNINRQVPGVGPGSTVRRAVVSSFGERTRVQGWNCCRVSMYRVLPFGTLLGPEATGPKNSNQEHGWKDTGTVLFLVVPAQV